MSQRPLLKDEDLNLPTSSADAQPRPNEFFPTRKAREFFAVPEGDPPNPAPRWILWCTAILYGMVIIGAACGWFIYSFAFQNCGWKQQAYDPKLPTCSFRSGTGNSAEDPSSSGTVILPNAVTLKYQLGGQGIHPFFQNQTCRLLYDSSELGGSWDTAKNKLITNISRVAYAAYGFRIGEPPSYQLPPMNCGGPKGFNVTVFMKSPGLQLDFAKVGAVTGTSMFENISLGVDKIFKDFTGDVTAVFPSTTIIQTLSLFMLFYEDDRPTNYRSHVSYFHGFSSYESAYKNLLASSNDAQFLTDDFKGNQSGVFKFGVRDAVRRVTLDRQDLKRNVEAEVEAYLGSQEMYWCYSCGNRNWFDSLFYAGPNVNTLNEVLMSFIPAFLLWTATATATGRL